MSLLGSLQSLHSGQCLLHPRAAARAGASRAQSRVMADVGEERPMPKTQNRPKVLLRPAAAGACLRAISARPATISFES